MPEKKDRVEEAGIVLVFWLVLGMIIFALAILVVHPPKETESFSELLFTQRPFLDTNGGKTDLVFGIRLNSFEENDTAYHVSVLVEGKLAAAKEVALESKEWEEIVFRIPIKGNFQAQNEVRVKVTRASNDLAKKDERLSLEIVDWFYT